ncbi:putative spermidine synthase [Oesophagostomum dentatum]|uniref:Putative spermidine synthase n=1 Tax=Oesophagostomum dentatum TaxID=61180 RepID=A0A0B1SLA0_OESDE|nr:putative spermidine synthase [Oesophagostomum dentatum]
MDLLHKGWFTEFSPDDLERMKHEGSGDSKQLKSDGVAMGGAWPGQAFSLKVIEILFHEKSDYQDVLVFKRFLPGMSCCFSDPKLNLFCGDGFEFLKKHKNEFDVIITDSSDPVGPAESLFGQSYYELLRDSLNENGVLSSQGECPWLDLALIGKVVREYCLPLFPVVRYACGSVPTYTSGLMGYVVCSKSKDLDVTKPSRTLSDDDVKRMKLRFYNSQVHSAAFVLPQFIKEELEKK